MTIKAKVGFLTVDVGTTDTTLISAPATNDRLAISAMSMHNTTVSGTSIEVEIFISPDTTSTAGKRVAHYILAGEESVDIGELIGQGISTTENVIAVADVAGLNIKTTVTEFSAGS